MDWINSSDTTRCPDSRLNGAEGKYWLLAGKCLWLRSAPDAVRRKVTLQVNACTNFMQKVDHSC